MAEQRETLMEVLRSRGIPTVTSETRDTIKVFLVRLVLKPESYQQGAAPTRGVMWTSAESAINAVESIGYIHHAHPRIEIDGAIHAGVDEWPYFIANGVLILVLKAKKDLP